MSTKLEENKLAKQTKKSVANVFGCRVAVCRRKEINFHSSKTLLIYGLIKFHSFDDADDLGFGDRETAGNLCGNPACLLLAWCCCCSFWLQDCVLRVVMDHAFKDYVAGLAAGVATVVIGHPFDTVKVGNKTICVCFVFFPVMLFSLKLWKCIFFFLLAISLSSHFPLLFCCNLAWLVFSFTSAR
jgi:hypothetical protein